MTSILAIAVIAFVIGAAIGAGATCFALASSKGY